MDITAKELFDKMLEENEECTSTEMMIEFAKIHVQKSLQEAANKAQIIYEWGGNTGSEYCDEKIDRNSILNSYNINLIK